MELPLWHMESTPSEVKHGFSDVYVQVVDTTGRFLCRIYIPNVIRLVLGDKYISCEYFPSVYGFWATRLLVGGVQSISEYDTFFDGYPDHEYSPYQVLFNKARIALCRLRFPYELSEEHKLAYEQYLIQHARLTIQKLAFDKNFEMLTYLLEKVTIPLQKYNDMVDWSVETQLNEITAILLEHRSRTWGDSVLSLSLEDNKIEPDDDEVEPPEEDDSPPFFVHSGLKFVGDEETPPCTLGD